MTPKEKAEQIAARSRKAEQESIECIREWNGLISDTLAENERLRDVAAKSEEIRARVQKERDEFKAQLAARDMPAEPELLPCPCGAKARPVRTTDDHTWLIECEDCNCRWAAESGSGSEHAIGCWNRRATPPEDAKFAAICQDTVNGIKLNVPQHRLSAGWVQAFVAEVASRFPVEKQT